MCPGSASRLSKRDTSVPSDVEQKSKRLLFFFMRTIFLDIDGVLNDHRPFPNHYCGIKPECLACLTTILEAAPDVKIVLSSAWRYLVHAGAFNERGLEYLLNIHGAPYELYHQRIIGTTETDEETCLALGIMEKGADLDYAWLKENGHEIRVIQIERFAQTHNIGTYVVIDDLPLSTPALVQTDPSTGLLPGDVDRVLRVLESKEYQ